MVRSAAMGLLEFDLLTEGTTFSSATSAEDGSYCLLSNDGRRLSPDDGALERPPPVSDGSPDVVDEVPSSSVPGGGPLACSFRNALNSVGAISGCSRAGTQNKWNGSSEGTLGALPFTELCWFDDPSCECEELDSPSVSGGVSYAE